MLKKAQTKPTFPKPSDKKVLAQKALQAYAEAQTELKVFQAKHAEIISAYNCLKAQAAEREDEAKNAAKAAGDTGSFTVKGYRLVVSSSYPRVFNVRALLDRYPDAYEWPGLLTVSAKNWDSYVSTGRVDETGVKLIVSKQKEARISASLEKVDD